MADAGDARRLLREHGDVFRAQLVAARWLDGYRLRRLADFDLLAGSIGPSHSRDHKRGFDEAMRDVVAHLRQGAFLPGGILYDDEIEGRNDPRPPGRLSADE